MIDIQPYGRLKRNKKRNGFIGISTGPYSYGKVILPRNGDKLHDGFAQFSNVEDRGRYFLADMENIPVDYYPGIPFEELDEVLRRGGFIQEYKEKITSNPINYFYIYANLLTGVIITIETYNNDKTPDYNSINVFVHKNFDGLATEHWRDLGLSSIQGGYGGLTEYNIVNSRNQYPLSVVLSTDMGRTNWNGDIPFVQHYGDDIDTNYAVRSYNATCRILLCKDPIHILFNMQIGIRLNWLLDQMTPEEKSSVVPWQKLIEAKKRCKNESHYTKSIVYNFEWYISGSEFMKRIALN